MAVLLMLSLLWVVRTLLALLPPLWWWQTKEYRWDRFWTGWKEGEGRGILFGRLWLARLPLFGALLVLWPLLADPDPFFSSLALMIYFAEVVLLGARFRFKLLAMPVFTLRLALTFFGAALMLLAAGVALLMTGQSLPLFVLSLILLDVTAPFAASAWVALVSPLASKLKRRVIIEAKLERAKHPELIAVGITGSYGKTSTKEFVAQLLQERFTVFKTQEHENSEVAVARRLISVCSELGSYKQLVVGGRKPIFIAEMGAYRKGEIRALAEMVQPSIGILTGLTDQHLSLFGSRENIVSAKWELAESLPRDGTLIFNADVHEFRERAKTFRGKAVGYGFGEGADCRAANVREETGRILAKINIGNEVEEVSVPLLGAFQLSNVLAAIALAHALGVSLRALSPRLGLIRPLPKTMEPRRGPKGSVIIDDSYSANPAGVVAAIRFLRHFPGKKIVVLPSLIELGLERVATHRRIGQALAELPADLVIVTDSKAERSLRGGFRVADGRGGRLIFSAKVEEVLGHVAPLLGGGAVLLLAGRVPPRLLSILSRKLFV